MITQKRLLNQITELRVAYMFASTESIMNLVAKIFESLKELTTSGKIVKVQEKTTTHFVYDVLELNVDKMSYRDNKDDQKILNLLQVTHAEVYDRGMRGS